MRDWIRAQKKEQPEEAVYKERKHRRGWHVMFSTFLAAALCMTSLPAGGKNVLAADEQGEKGAQYSKEEVVYASLSSDGNVNEIYVVNAFNLPKSGKISDYGTYSLLENLTDTKALAYENGRVTAQAQKGRFYYQGNMESKELPWWIQVKYTLDGKAVSAQQLADAKGKVGIEILTSQNKKVDPVFYEKYMLQVTVTLDTGVCENIEAQDATMANAGSDKQITFTVMPKKDARLKVSADADGFYMKGISIAAVPFSAGADMLDVGQIDQLTDGLNQLSTGISQLNGGAQQLKGGVDALQSGTKELKNGVSEFQSGINQLKEGADSISGGAGLLSSGSCEFQSGLNQAAAISDDLVYGSDQINQALALLKAGTAELGNLDLAQLAALPDALTALADGLEGMQGGFVQIFGVLDGALAANPIQDLTEEEYAQLNQIMAMAPPETQAVLGKMMSNYQAAMTFMGTYQAVRSGVDDLIKNLDVMVENIRGMEAQLEVFKSVDPDGLKDLADGISALADQYAGFHEGLSEYMEGIKGLSGGYEEINSGIQGLYEGTSSLAGGISQSADGAAGLLGGADSLNGGAGELSEGVSQLADGIGTLNKETQKMPEEIKTKIDEMLEEYTNSDFAPVSFVSSKNQNVESVQFVFSTEEIKKAEVKTEKKAKETKEGVWEKLKGLF